MARDLETLKDVLWDQFEEAVKRQKDYADPDISSETSNEYASSRNFAQDNRRIIADLGRTILETIREERMAKEAAQDNLPIKKLTAGG